MKKIKIISMFFYGRLLPIQKGNQRIIIQLANEIRALGDLKLRLVIVTNELTEEDKRQYYQHFDDVVIVKSRNNNSILGSLNRICSRSGIDIFQVFFKSIEYIHDVHRAIKGSDYIILNYLIWQWLFPINIRKTKTFVITHDLLWYRRRSFWGTSNIFKRLLISLNRRLESYALGKFHKIGVFADYEEKYLIEDRIPKDKIIRMGMPILVKHEMPVKKNIKYDFFFMGVNILQNIESVKLFFKKVAPLIKKRHIEIAVVGSICNSDIWDKIINASVFSVTRFGYVKELSDIYDSSLIGIGTIPYGSGIKVKVVESIMYGLPMIATNTGMEGIPYNEDGIINIDKEEENIVAERLNLWLSNPELAIEIGRRQGNCLRKAFNPAIALGEVRDLIKSINN